MQLYDTSGFAEPIKHMIRDTEESTIVEHGIYTRSGEDIKPDWFGRGRVAIIGDAAHPMRPAGEWSTVMLLQRLPYTNLPCICMHPTNRPRIFGMAIPFG